MLKERLESLDAQAHDLREAIAKTRAPIADLDTLISTQFPGNIRRAGVRSIAASASYSAAASPGSS